jgi:hypothetical protein
MANTLDNFSLYLWKNPEGYHVTVTTNYNTSNEQRSFFSFGNQTYKSWKAFNLHQPVPLKEFFENFKSKYKNDVKEFEQYWISKLGVNTGTKGRRTAPGAMILFEDNSEYGFIVHFKEHVFRGMFDDNALTAKQKQGAKGVCLGSYIWKDDDLIQDYAEAF